MFENIIKFFKGMNKKNDNAISSSKDTAKERLHLVLMQDRANVSADFLELMKQEIIEVIKKYIDVDESAIDVRLTNKENSDGTNGAPALYANIPIKNIKNDVRKMVKEESKTEKLQQDNQKEEKVPSIAENKEKEKQAEQKVEQAEEIIEEVETSKSNSKLNDDNKEKSDAKKEDKKDKIETENKKSKEKKSKTNNETVTAKTEENKTKK